MSESTPGAMAPGQVRVLQGPRALARAIAEQLECLAAESRAGLARHADSSEAALGALLQAPVRLVVPSRSLREHLASWLVTGPGALAGRAFLGLRVQSLEALVREVLERVGAGCVESPLHALHVRRLARREPSLARALDGFDDGYQVVAAAVDDLLDAGLEPAHAEFLLERSAELGGEAARRVAALVRVAARLAAAPASASACHRAQRLARARRAIEASPDRALPTRALFLAGFQDATGVQSDLLEALVRTRGARVLFEQPGDPVAGAGCASAFGERLRVRLGAPPHASAEAQSDPEARIEMVRAPDREAEVRALAGSLRALLDAGASPERIGVVARDLSPYRAALRRQLARAALPFSGCGEPGFAGGVRVRLDALLELLERRARASTERWLDARMRLPGETGEPEPSLAGRARLRQELHRHGCLQLRDLARLRAGSHGLGPAQRAAAAELLGLDELARGGTLEQHATRLHAWVRKALGWSASGPGDAALAALDEALRTPDVLAVGEEPLDFEEFTALLRRRLAACGADRLGGAGGGVQVLGVVEARSRCFDTLFVLGLNRGVFPRVVSDDPFLSDALRARLRDVLPDLPVKSEAHEEERFLFAQLLESAPRVVLSFADVEDPGGALAPSPLLERLRSAGRLRSQRTAPPLHAPAADGGPRPASEHALLAGLGGGLAAQELLLPAALGRAVPPALCGARARVLRELDAYRGPRGSLGPYFGFVAGRAEGEPPSVTLLERVLRCPWQAFLSRILGLEPVPDALAALPRRDGEQRLLGIVVHGALEHLLSARLATVSGALQATPWPEPAQVEDALQRASESALEGAGIAVPGYARVLARRAAPFVAAARMLDEGETGATLDGVEVEGRAAVGIGGGATRSVRFRADRVDRVAGRLRFSDYKTGRPRLPGGDDAEKLRAALARSGSLQAVVYAAAEPEAQGRYVYLRPDLDPAARARSVEGGGQGEAIEGAFATAFGVLESGAFVPRLRAAREDSEPDACRRCDVRDACLRGDSGARGRLSRFMEGRNPEAGGPALRAATALWQLELAR